MYTKILCSWLFCHRSKEDFEIKVFKFFLFNVKGYIYVHPKRCSLFFPALCVLERERERIFFFIPCLHSFLYFFFIFFISDGELIRTKIDKQNQN